MLKMYEKVWVLNILENVWDERITAIFWPWSYSLDQNKRSYCRIELISSKSCPLKWMKTNMYDLKFKHFSLGASLVELLFSMVLYVPHFLNHFPLFQYIPWYDLPFVFLYVECKLSECVHSESIKQHQTRCSHHFIHTLTEVL